MGLASKIDLFVWSSQCMEGRDVNCIQEGESDHWVGRATPLIRVCVLGLCLFGFEFALL